MEKAFLMTPKGAVGLGLVFLLLGLAVFGPFLAPHDPLKTDLAYRLKPPSREFPLGTDSLGRCQWSRILWGARVSLGTGILALSFALFLGGLMGTASVSSSKIIQGVIKGWMDIALAFPGMVWALLMIGIFGPSVTGMVVGLAAAAWAWWARFSRSLIMTALAREFVMGGRMVGVKGIRLWVRYIFPQIWSQLLIAASLRCGWTILLTAGMGFLGLGAQPPTPEWGTMLQESRLYMVRAPWLMIAPGAAIFLTVLALNLFSEGLQEALGNNN
jgi:ABC-type dipeptide/oligopeptide/nickel transport system permease subunit